MKPLAALACLLLLAGCSAAPEAPVAVTAPTTVAPWTPTETYRTPTAKPVTFTIRCGGATFTDFRQAWTRAADLDLSLCEASLISGTAYTQEQAAAARAAGYADVASVRTLYALCAEVEGYYTEPKTALGPDQITEINGGAHPVGLGVGRPQGVVVPPAAGDRPAFRDAGHDGQVQPVLGAHQVLLAWSVSWSGCTVTDTRPPLKRGGRA